MKQEEEKKRAMAKRTLVHDVFQDFKGRRNGIVKALTTDYQQFRQKCDPAKEVMCLYGLPNETWEVNFPVPDVPTHLPEPVVGINFNRDTTPEEEWLASIAHQSDGWLLSIAFHYSARFEFDKTERQRLFNMINDLPTISEAVSSYTAVKQVEKKKPVLNPSAKSSEVKQQKSRAKHSKVSQHKHEDEVDDTPCGACGEQYVRDGFWICCDVCEKWFHGKCVRMTPALAEQTEKYCCPFCAKKKA